MSLERQNLQPASQTDRHYKNLSILAKTALAAVVVAGVIASGVFYTSGTAWFGGEPGDDVSVSDQKLRTEAFEAIKYLPVSKVAAAEFPTAFDSMHLTPDEQSRLRLQLAQSPATSPTHATPADASSTKTSGDNAGAAAAHTDVAPAPAPATTALAQAAPATQAAQPVLVWVRLWDSNVEDGDVVRIDSAGYSRTVSLTNRGITFAVPVSASGQIRITGIRDGDGGGITVGLGSGSAQAILPIMSVGQVLTLNVRTN
ncbi:MULTISPECIES: hypothetical protein [Paraburkholderia]|uniref:hypothetical protein n=1 Tax=Paraburkholderia TaxID=1822464 RepID=UPI002254ABA0|nr:MULTISPECIES: hypothetical protein [Paraburkholderia]MCX4162859.1 hypothetical protein [Paraburkholderia megapolitana]MDN7158354.1 hypothetical protein [Paraburkholderia sp. CHISQ3]MDQ6495401.1 hypothetical protein [Paraburkholderia megapolitana]